MTMLTQEAGLIERNEVLQDVLSGLSRAQKTLPGKYLWDEAGSSLFDRICHTQDYYLTRCEGALLRSTVEEIGSLVGFGATIVEFGSGASHKVRLLLDAFTAPTRYVALDISREYLEAATLRLAADYPGIEVSPVCADYTKQISLPIQRGVSPILGFFPGSTIGNFDPAGTVAFLTRARETLGPSWFLVGADSNTDEQSLLRAYGQADGLMAELHRNLLVHLNHVLGTAFGPGDFRHEARVQHDPFRVEAHLVATKPLMYQVGEVSIPFGAGESIHTDTSYKYDPDTFQSIANQAGWRSVKCWCDEQNRLCLYLLQSS
jgi:dimethylhistidine N-methyltransferase